MMRSEPHTEPTGDGVVTRDWLISQLLNVTTRLNPELAQVLRPLRGLNPADAPVVPSIKVWFGAGCRCGTAAVLTVEVSKRKTRSDVKAVLPMLVERLRAQYRAFRSMPCSSHAKLRTEFGSDRRRE